MSILPVIGCLVNATGAILTVRGHPYIGHWFFLIADPILAFYAFSKGEYVMCSLYLFYTSIAVGGILYYHNKVIKEVLKK